MRKWLCLSLLGAALGCVGGRDPVRTVSGDGEYAGPGAADPFNDGQGEGGEVSSSSTLEALCIKACAHLHAMDCEGAPAQSVGECEGACKSDLIGVPTWCAEEKAALYRCTIDAEITCSATFSNAPIVNDCESESSHLQECFAPGSDCAPSPQNDELCFQMGFSTFLICSEGIVPPPECIQITSSAFCCP